MSNPDQTTEAEIQAKGLTAARVSLADLEANIAHVEIVKHVSASGQVLDDLHVGDDKELGERLATENARNEMWALMGYALKDRISRAGAEA